MGKETKHFYDFGPFRLDPVSRLLLREDKPVALTPKVFNTLLVLVQSHVTRRRRLATRLPRSAGKSGVGHAAD